ncbi:tape measure protein [Comamonas sp. F1-6]|uniref:tape measure protein n=1 Tax=Comamonas sp. F1-6 TaxID=673550 RepID=UPI0031D106B0
MSALGSLVVKLALEYAQFTQGLNKSEQQALASAKRIQDSVDSVRTTAGNLFKTLAAGITVAGTVNKLVSVQREFDVLNSSLVTVTGSSAAAQREMGWLKDFAKDTPYGLAQATEAFVKMKALGLNPTRESLTSFGNTASAMGKDLLQMIEAVADASSGEFERLKEFGVKSSQEGENVKFTFQGVTTTVRKSSEEITAYLEAIGNNQFASAMAERAQTLDGAIAALGDTWDELFRTVNQNNTGGFIYESVTLASTALENLNTILQATNEVATEGASASGAFKTVQDGLAVAFETVAVLGTNVKYVLKGVGTELGGLAAQAAAIARGDFAGAAEIHRQMVSDAQAARIAVDAQTEAILSARQRAASAAANKPSAGSDLAALANSVNGYKALTVTDDALKGLADGLLKSSSGFKSSAESMAEVRKKGDEINAMLKRLRAQGLGDSPEAQKLEARLQGVGEKLKSMDEGAKGSAQSAKQLQTSYAGTLKTLDDKIAAQKLELSTGDALTESAKLRLKVEQDLKSSLSGLSQAQREVVQARLNSIESLEQELELQRQQVKALEEERAYRQQWWGDQAKTVDELNAGNKSLREEIELIGLNAVQQANVLRLRAQSVLLTKEQQLAEMERAAQLTGTMTREQASLQQEIELLRERMVLMGTRESREASAQAAQASVQEWQTGVNQISQSLTDQLMDGGRTFGEYLENLGRTLVFRPVIQTIAQPVGSSVTSILGLGPQTAGANGAAGMLGGVNSLSSLYSAVSGGLVSSVGGAIGTLGTMLGSNALTSFAAGMKGASLAAGLAGPTTAGASGAVGLGATVASALPWVAGGLAVLSLAGGLKGIFGGKVTKRGEGIDGQLGGDLRAYADYKKSGGWFGSNKYWTDYGAMEGNAQIQATFAALQTSITQQAKALGVSADAVATYTRKIRFSTEGLSGDQVAARLQEEMAAAGDEMAALVLGTAQYTKAGETATATLQRLTGSLGVVNTTLEVTRGKLFDVGLAGASMASDLVDRFGGLDAYISASEAYYQAYYTQAERANQSTDAMRKQLEALGLTLPQSREQFRQLVGSLDLTTASGREAYATLIKMAPQFDETATMLDELARAAAADLIATYTKAAAVAPGMKIAQDAMAAVVTQSDRFAGSVSIINKILGDSSSGVLVFGDRVQTVTSALDPAQLAVQRLRAEIMDMQASASGTVVDIDGLAKALDGVDVRTFSATVVGVFDLIANRIRSNLADIASEREAVREAAISIIAPRVMTPAQIREQVKAQTVALPNQNGIASAQAALAKADTLVKQREAEWSAAVANNANRSPGLYNSAAQLEAQRGNAARNLVATYLRFGKVQDGVWGESMSGGLAGLATYNDTQANMLAKMQNLPTAEIQAFADQLTRLGKSGLSDGYSSTATYLQMMESYKAATANEAANQAKAAGLREQAAALAAKATTAEQALAAARAQQSAATGNAQKAQLDYVAALQKYSMDSGKAVSNLSKLREETVAWYQSQAQLAQTMGDSAAGLRQTVADVRFSMLDTPAQFANLQERFNVAYSMAMSTSGETLAGYGNELNSLLNPLLQKAQEAGLSSSEYSSLVQTMLARAEAVANRLDKEAPKNYQEESLGLLGQIDSTLAALEAGAKSTEQLMVEAIKAGTDTTRDGLRAVIAVLRGQAVPAFAEGGLHAGGLRLVGERGRELEVTGAARYYSAEQTARLLAGAQPPVVAQLMQSPGVDLRPLVDEMQQQRRDFTGLLQKVAAAAEAGAVNTGRLQRNVDRITVEGMPVRNVENEHLVVQVEAADAADPAN